MTYRMQMIFKQRATGVRGFFAVLLVGALLSACGGDPPLKALLTPDPRSLKVTAPPSGLPTPSPTGGSRVDPALDLNPTAIHSLDGPRPSAAPTTPVDYSKKCVVTRGAESNKVGIGIDVNGGNYTELLDSLAEARLQVTFFVPGEFVAQNADAYKLMAKDGHEIAPHGYTHVRLGSISSGLLVSDVTKASVLLTEGALGAPISRLVRLPFADGVDDKRVTDALCGAGYQVASWEILDADVQEGYDAAILDRETLATLVTGGRFLYISSAGATDSRTIRDLVGFLAERSLKGTTISDALGLPVPAWRRPAFPRPTPTPVPTATPAPSATPAPASTAAPSPPAAPSATAAPSTPATSPTPLPTRTP